MGKISDYIYVEHKPHCNRMQDWTEAFEALSNCPDGPDKVQAYEELNIKQKTCTCGLDMVYNNSTESVKDKTVIIGAGAGSMKAVYEAIASMTDRLRKYPPPVEIKVIESPFVDRGRPMLLMHPDDYKRYKKEMEGK